MADAIELEPGLRRILAPNPSPMTAEGTNTYLLGDREVTVIDPGPDLPAHLDAILAATRGARIARILVTHSHLDHSALAGPLARATGATILAFGGSRAGRSPVMEGLEEIGGGEGVDAGFAPDLRLEDGTVIDTGAGPVEAIWTPGHFGNHMVFLWNGAAFSGDLVMGWASSLVSPPDGDLTRFMTSCRRLAARAPRVLHSGHGAPVEAPAARIDWLIAHRKRRERQILDALAAGPADAATLARGIYTDTAAALMPAATRNVLAHLIDLTQKNAVAVKGRLSAEARFERL